MQNKNLNNSYPLEEINLIDLFNLLINSKKTIIVITLICTLITTGLYFIKEPSYQSRADLIIGHYDNHKLLNTTNIVTEMNFFLVDPKETLFELKDEQNLGKFFTAKVTGSSENSTINSLKEIIDYMTDKSNKVIEQRIEEDKFSLYRINNQVAAIEVELNRLLNLEEVPNADYRRDVFISELSLELDELRFSGEVLSNKLGRSSLFERTKLYREIRTYKLIPPTPLTSFILMGSIVGFMLSMLIVYIRKFLLQAQK